MKQNIWSVWVGGEEVNDCCMAFDDAERLAFEYEENGYDDVYVEETNF